MTLPIPQCSFLSVVFMMAFVVLFDQMHWRHRRERVAALAGRLLFDWTPRNALSPLERANRLYAMGELAAAAELFAKSNLANRHGRA